ncbi:hypothetical protein [Corynebacterium sp. NML130628]|uniref:hypothetical protein n=1 Tax=Corynebacterium sp. NML130628 TaxID=1906333 RepID=UPI0008FAFB1A|nr:hypothetical protein [Corynebacterium sp. NML130628]OIR45458.1 hypothetical protein BJP07_03580 [Corynebacterium sp. NML130628]
MRNFRKAALAGATAVAVAFGSATVATAEETPTPTPTTNVVPDKQIDKNKNLGGSSTKLGHKLGAWEKDKDGKVQAKGANAKALFGLKKEGFDNQPLWAKLGYVLTVFTSVAAAVGVFVGPAYNFIVHGLPTLNK